MPKIYYAKEIYKKLPVSLQHPTALDTPIVPIRGLYVAGLHRNIFNIDHCVQITALENQPTRWVNYTRITADMPDDGGFILRGIKRRNMVPSIVKYSRTTASMADDGGFIMRGIKRRNMRPSITPYGKVNVEMPDDGGFIMRGIKRRNTTPSKVPRPTINHDHIGDSHCVKILDISNSPVDITSYSE